MRMPQAGSGFLKAGYAAIGFYPIAKKSTRCVCVRLELSLVGLSSTTPRGESSGVF
jgi:hypothetical protein